MYFTQGLAAVSYFFAEVFEFHLTIYRFLV
jgi:hypothetical protein